MNTGLIQRWQRVFLPQLPPARDWLDQTLEADPSGAISAIFNQAASDQWPESDRAMLDLCQAEYSGEVFLVEQLARLTTPEAEEGESSQIVWRAFTNALAFQDPARERVQLELLKPERVQALTRFPAVYGGSIQHLLELLTLADRLTPELAIRAREVAFGLQLETDPPGAVLQAHAVALTMGLLRGQSVPETLQWLRDLAAVDNLPLNILRAAFEPFLDGWTSMPPETQRACVEALLEMAEGERYQALWEFRKLRRDWNTWQSYLGSAPDPSEA